MPKLAGERSVVAGQSSDLARRSSGPRRWVVAGIVAVLVLVSPGATISFTAATTIGL